MIVSVMEMVEVLVEVEDSLGAAYGGTEEI